MFAKDPKTISLIEVGETVKANYLNDTKKLSTIYLTDAISLINNCEINFKNVRNRRVHIELTLMQLASLNFDGEKKNYIIPASKIKKNISNIDVSENISKETKIDISYKKNEIDNYSEIENKAENGLKRNDIDPLEPVSSYSLSSIALKKAASKILKPNKKIIKSEEIFKLETLKKYLKEYVENLNNEGKKNIASILSMNPIKLKENNKILFKVANEMNRVEVNLEKEKLLPFLKKHLRNDKIKLEVEIFENRKQEQIHTATEKYQYLLKLNPQLEELIKKFNLDF